MGLNKKLVCKQIKKNKIEARPFCTVSFKFNSCKCRCFSLADYKTVDDLNCGKGFVSGNQDLNYCEKVSGFFVKEWAEEIGPKIKLINNLYRNLCD